MSVSELHLILLTCEPSNQAMSSCHGVTSSDWKWHHQTGNDI